MIKENPESKDQSEPRGRYKQKLPAKYNRRVGFRERREPVIGALEMRFGEDYFWGKRGIKVRRGAFGDAFK